MTLGTIGGMMMGQAWGGVPRPSEFEEQMTRSMERMHADMAVPPSGDPDRDFAAMMIPHHQGAIDMAKAELAYGRDPVLRRLAQGVVVEQAQEVEVMQRAMAALPPARKPQAGAHGLLHGHEHGNQSSTEIQEDVR